MNDDEKAQAAAINEAVLRKQTAPYTQLPNRIVQAIRNPDALAIWAYLNSKSSNWRILRGHLTDHFGLGRDRYTKAMRDLRDAGLISDQFVRDGTRIVGRELYVHLEPYLQVSVYTETVSDGKPVGSYETQDKSTKEKTTTPPNPQRGRRRNATKPKPAIGQERYTPEFERAWKAWPSGKGGVKLEAFQRWEKMGAAEHVDMIVSDIENRKANDRQWKGGVYVPRMSTYLNKHGWTAAIDTTEDKGKTDHERQLEASQHGRRVVNSMRSDEEAREILGF